MSASNTARFLRITVSGNTQNDWASITKVGVTANPPANIAAVTSSGDDGNVAANVLDTNPDSRWSCLGKGSWIQFDLGGQIAVFSVFIAWYKGDQRKSTFNISLSTDGTTFNTVFTGTSSGTTLGLEEYKISSITPTPTPTPTPTDGNVDKFGVKKIYPTKVGGEEWYLSSVSDPQFKAGSTITRNADGTFKLKNAVARCDASTSALHDESKCVTNQQTLIQRKYMQTSKDWHNIEMTGYLKYNHGTGSSANGGEHIEFLCRGSEHHSTNGCLGTSYHSNIYPSGRSKFEKELQHTSGYATNDPQKTGAFSSTAFAKGKWIGHKFICFDNPDGSITLQQYVDTGNGFVKTLETTDTGHWGGGSNPCGAGSYQKIVWGGPIVIFRWDQLDDVDFKWFSVREIQPPS